MSVPANSSAVWFKQKEGKVFETLSTGIDKLTRDSDGRMQRMAQHLRLYSDRRAYPLHLGAAIARDSMRRGGSTRPPLSLNVVRNIVDAATSKLAESRPTTAVSTRQGDFTLQQKARKQQYFIDAQYDNEELYPKRQKAIKAATLLGTGCVKVVEWEGRVSYETVFPGELRVDEYDALYGNPNCLYQAKLWDRDELIDKFPSKKKIIEEADVAGMGYFGRIEGADQVLVTEAWRKGKRGRHTMCVSSGDLRDEEWKSEFPFGFWHWSEEPLGFWGTGLGAILTGIQLELNAVLQTIQANVYQGANLTIFIPNGSGIEDAHINNDLRARIIRGNAKPEWMVHDMFSPQLVQHISLLLEQAYQVSGMSQLSASGQIPAGLAGSGRAQLVYNNIESQRFLTFGRQDEQTMRNLAYRTFEAAMRIAERPKSKLVVTTKQKNWLVDLTVDKDLLDTSDTQITMSPASIIPKTFAGKMAAAEKFIEMGKDRASTFKMLGLADYEAEDNLERAPRELIDMMIERMLEEGEWMPPYPRMDLVLALEIGTLSWQRAKLNGYPDDRIDMLNQWLDTVQGYLDEAEGVAPVDPNAPANDTGLPPGAPALPPGGGEPGLAPMGGDPMPPPVPVPQGVPAEVAA